MTPQIIRHEQNHMATTFIFSISAPSEQIGLADRILRSAHLEVSRLENDLSEYLENSPVYQLNHKPAGTKVIFSEDAFSLLLRALELKRLTAGAFDPLCKSKGAHPQIEYTRQTREVWVSEGTWVGFGAIGKGFAIERVRNLIEGAGFGNYLLSAGGSSIALSGYEKPGSPWRWGWSWKKNTDGANLGLPFTHHSGKRIALGVSGTHEQGRHILSANEKDAEQELKSSLIATTSPADADALSTALFIDGWERSKNYLDELPLPPAVAWVDHHENSHWNWLFKNLFLSLCVFFLGARSAFCDDSVDLGTLGNSAQSFTPYVFDRNFAWILLPLAFLLLVLLHLKKTKPIRGRKKLMTSSSLKTPSKTLLLALLAWASVERVSAVEIEPMGKAIASLLGTTKAFKKPLNDGTSNVDTYYSKGENGKAQKIVFIEKGLYPPSCTHTWAIGLDVASGSVTEVRPLEMACPHAYPTKSASFLSQFQGKGPADVSTLDSDVHTVAKATGTSKLATDAVKRSILTLAKYKGQF